jgi:hypothetical protein
VSGDDIEQLEHDGADGFIKKPFDVDKLMKQVEELLGL